VGSLRLLLALSVVVWHLPATTTKLVHGGMAVVLFYIISGFYMALVLNERYERARDFYIARALRIYPTYYAICALILVWYGYHHTATLFFGAMGQPPLAHAALLAMNFLLFGQDLFQGMINLLTFTPRPDWQAPALAIAAHFPRNFFTDPPFMLIGQAWSLGTELLFYLVAPFIVRSPKRILVWFFISVAIRVTLIAGFHLPGFVWGYQLFPATLCIFLLGSAAYHLYRRVKDWQLARHIAAGAVAVAALLAVPPLVQDGGIFMVGANGYDSLGLWLFYLAFAASLAFLFARWKNNRLDRALGELSYPLYLVHGVTLGIIGNVFQKPGWAILGSLAAAAVIYLVVDYPIDRWRHRHVIGSPTPRTIEAIPQQALETT
jgi:peptidoglycan/LPS O-acetylase OafA/YrhL